MSNDAQMCNGVAMSGNVRLDELRLLAKISKLYYEQDYTSRRLLKTFASRAPRFPGCCSRRGMKGSSTSP